MASHDDDSEPCPVCLDTFQDETAMLNVCRHMFWCVRAAQARGADPPRQVAASHPPPCSLARVQPRVH